jgi:hypothetical protein
MRWKWITIGAAGLGALLGIVVLAPIWIVSSLLLRSEGSTATTASLPPSAPAPSTGGIQPAPPVVDPRLSSASMGPSQTPHPMTRGISRATRAALTNQLGAAMSELTARLEKCPDQHIHRGGEVTATQAKMIETVQRQIAGGGDREIVAPQIAGRDDRVSQTELPTIMMLEVETYDSQVKIVDAALAMPGSASDAFVACARQVLRGQIIAVPAAPTGEHLQIPVDLSGAGTGGQPQRHSMRRRR